jgi:hypothetical protein
LIGASVFVYYRTINKQRRMTLSGEGLLILGIIMTMMLADMLYDGVDGAEPALPSRVSRGAGASPDSWCSSAATIIAPLAPPPKRSPGIPGRNRREA